jgi:hypothetical protein
VRRLALLLIVVATSSSLISCESVDKARMKLFGIKVCSPEPETAEWVINEVVQAAKDTDEERGWVRLQKVLHSSERTPNALRGWQDGNWPRMRKQVSNYLDDQGCFTLRDFRTQQGDRGIDFFVENRQRDMPTPCAVYQDENNNRLWRVKRCSL